MKKQQLEKRTGPKAANVRWTVNLASAEFDTDRNWLTRELAAANELPGADGKYSTQQMVRVIFGGKKAREAREAKYQQQIDEAEMVRNERELQEGKLCYVSHLRDRLADVFTAAVQIIRHADITETLKEEVIKTLADLKLPPTQDRGNHIF